MSTYKIPINSNLSKTLTNINFADNYECVIYDKNNAITIEQIGKYFFMSGPKWIDALFNMRNKLAKNIGLKIPAGTKPTNDAINNFKFQIGDQYGLFKVFDKNEHEIILGEDDKHLNFRVSLFLETIDNTTFQKKLSITTAVMIHNKFGQFYLSAIKPFHKIIVTSMLNNMKKAISNLH